MHCVLLRGCSSCVLLRGCSSCVLLRGCSSCVLWSTSAAVHDRDPNSTGLAQGRVCNLGSGEKGVCVCVCCCMRVISYVRTLVLHRRTYVAGIVLPMQKVVSDLQKEISEQQQKRDRVARQTAKLQKEIRAKKGTLEATTEEVRALHCMQHFCASNAIITACCMARKHKACH